VPTSVLTFGSYYTGKGPNGWQGAAQTTYAVNAFVKALKGVALSPNSYNDIPVPRRGLLPMWKTALCRLDATTQAGVYGWFAEMAHRALPAWAETQVLFVPVPCSKGDSQDAVRDSGPMKMADALAAVFRNGSAHPALWLDQTMPSASKAGGPRNPASIFPHLLHDFGVRPAITVLVDDVCTSGGHLRACAAKLKSVGHACTLGLAGAQSDDLEVDNPWRVELRELDDFVP
jgi:hypothetical protein